MQIFDAQTTANRLPFERLIPAVAQAMLDLKAGRIRASSRTVLPLPDGGNYLVMPCTDDQYAMTKLVAVTPANRQLGLATIQGRVLVSDARTGTPLMLMDGPVVTAKRTAAVTLLGVETLLGRRPSRAVLVGTGAQALAHALAMTERWPGLQLRCVGSNRSQSEAFAAALARAGLRVSTLPIEQALDAADVVVTATTSLTAVLPEHVDAATLIVGLGSYTPQMAELPASQIKCRQIWVDNIEGARHEAGVLLQARVDWTRVFSLADGLSNPSLRQLPMLYKTVGHAAWDLAAVRTAMSS